MAIRWTLLTLLFLSVAGLTACADPPRPAESEASPAERAVAREEATKDAGTLVDGGKDELERRIDAVEGLPVVVNQWASWCSPCRYEFPFLDRLARQLRGQVAFIGLNSEDGRNAATHFLEDNPTPFVHVFDPDSEAAASIGGARSMPTTVFFDATGERIHVMQGAYATQEKLLEAIAEHAVGTSPAQLRATTRR